MGNMIDLDMTIFIQLVNFIVTIVVLNYLLIKPVRNQIASRNSILSGYASEIEGFNAGASGKLTAYEQALEQARTAAGAVREEKKNEGVLEEKEILARAKEQSQSFLEASRAEIDKEAKAAMKALTAQVNAFATQAVAKIIG